MNLWENRKKKKERKPEQQLLLGVKWMWELIEKRLEGFSWGDGNYLNKGWIIQNASNGIYDIVHFSFCKTYH